MLNVDIDKFAATDGVFQDLPVGGCPCPSVGDHLLLSGS